MASNVPNVFVHSRETKAASSSFPLSGSGNGRRSARCWLNAFPRTASSDRHVRSHLRWKSAGFGLGKQRFSTFRLDGRLELKDCFYLIGAGAPDPSGRPDGRAFTTHTTRRARPSAYAVRVPCGRRIAWHRRRFPYPARFPVVAPRFVVAFGQPPTHTHSTNTIRSA